MRLRREDGCTCLTRACGTTRTLSVHGEIDMSVTGRLDVLLGDALADRPEIVLIDLEHTTFLDAAGIGWLVRACRKAVEQHTRMVMVPGPDAVQEVLHLAGVEADLPFARGAPWRRGRRERIDRRVATRRR